MVHSFTADIYVMYRFFVVICFGSFLFVLREDLLPHCPRIQMSSWNDLELLIVPSAGITVVCRCALLTWY